MQIIRDERNSFMDFEGVFIGNVTRLEDSLDMGKACYIATKYYRIIMGT